MKKNVMYEQIYNKLKDAIMNREFRALDQMPTEKELEESYHVSRITAKKAMDMLAGEGYIIRQAGKGSYVSKDIEKLIKKETLYMSDGEKTPGKRKRVGVIFDVFDFDFGGNLLRSIEKECRKRNYDMFFRCSYGSVEEETEAIHCAFGLDVDGMIIMCSQGEIYNSTILEMSLSHFPIVFIDRQIKGIPIPCVKTDNYEAARELTKILISRGHKNICFLTHASVKTSTIDERYRGFASCMVDCKDVVGVLTKVEKYNTTPEDAVKEYKEYNISEFEDVVRENSECTAYLAAEYKLAVLLERAVKNLGLTKEIVGFDGLEPIYDAAHEFTYVRQDEYEMGRAAVELLDKIVNGEMISENVNVPYEIVETKSYLKYMK